MDGQTDMNENMFTYYSVLLFFHAYVECYLLRVVEAVSAGACSYHVHRIT